MKKVISAFAYLAELKDVLLTVNGRVWNIDPLYAVYSWVSEAFYYVNNIAPLILTVVGVGYIIETPKPSWTVVLLGIGAFAAYMAIRNIAGSWASERRRVFDHLLSTELNLSHVEHLAKLDLGRLVDPAFIGLVHMVETRGRSSIQSLWNAQKNILSAMGGILISVVVLLTFDWIIGLIAVLMALPTIFKRWFAEQKRRELNEKEELVCRQRNEVRDMIASPNKAVLTRLLKLTKMFFGRYSELTDVLKNNVLVIARFERRWDVLVAIVTLLCVVAFGLYFSSGLVEGRYTLAEIGIILGSLRIVTIAVQEFGWAFGQMAQERKDYQYLMDFFQTGPLVDESFCSWVTFHNAPTLKLVRVGFSYPRQTKKVIDDLSLTIIAPGEKIAVVGPNGCGKTTLLRLISKVYNVSEGKLWADNRLLTAILQEAWICHVVMMTQVVSLPGMEIVRAITGGQLEDVDHSRLQKALDFSGSSIIVEELELGLNTWIGEEWPCGKGFSTGERQRFALAAAFYRILDRNVFIAMFDEPTANCDTQTKLKFYQTLAEAPELQDKTVLVSLHDPLYLRFFGRVIQLEAGKLVNDLRGKEEIASYQNEISMSLAQDL